MEMLYVTFQYGKGQNLHLIATKGAKKMTDPFDQNQISFITRYVYTYEEFVFVTESTAVKQNDNDRIKKKSHI